MTGAAGACLPRVPRLVVTLGLFLHHKRVSVSPTGLFESLVSELLSPLPSRLNQCSCL